MLCSHLMCSSKLTVLLSNAARFSPGKIMLRTTWDSRTSWSGKINLTHCGVGYIACSSQHIGLKGSAACNTVQNTRNCTSNDTMLQHRRHWCSAIPLRKPPISHHDHDSKVQDQPVFAVHETHFTSVQPISLKFKTPSTNSYQGGFFFEVFWQSL
jgi:hypothetical protein